MMPYKGVPLTAVLNAGVAVLVAISVLCTMTVVYILDETSVGRLRLERDERALDAAREQLLGGLLAQELGRVGVAATGSPQFLRPYRAGLTREADAWAALERALEGDAEAAPRLRRLQAAVERWHEEPTQPAQPRVWRNGTSVEPAPAHFRAHFDDIEQAMAELARNQQAATAARRAALARRARQATFFGAALFSALLTAAAFLTVWSNRRLALPLQRLSAQVERGKLLLEPPPTGAPAVREISTLREALVQLHRRVAEREAVLREERADAELMGRFSAIVQQATSEPELFRLLAQHLEASVAPAGIQVFALEGEGELVRVHPAADAPGGAPPEDAMACRALRSAREVLCPDRDDPGRCGCPLAAGPHLCLPLVATGQVIGLAALAAGDPDHWDERRRNVAASLVALASTGLHSIRLLARLREGAVRDALTHAFNRRFLEELLPKLVHQADRSGLPLSALMIDIDHFKAFNDQHGHESGDAVLAAVARCLAGEIRRSDTLIRYGGEEFLALLPDTPAASARALAERVRRAVETSPTALPRGRGTLGVTISVGAATFPDHARDGEALLRLADEALYRAKAGGRNRVEAALP